MRIVVVGASGNVGTAVLRRLRREPGSELAGVARRLPGPDAGEPYDGVEWHSCDIGAPDAADRLARIFAGADAVVHLAWQIQPSHDRGTLYRTNVGGSRAVIEAAVRAGVPALVYASSVGAYAPGPKDHPVSELAGDRGARLVVQPGQGRGRGAAGRRRSGSTPSCASSGCGPG